MTFRSLTQKNGLILVSCSVEAEAIKPDIEIPLIVEDMRNKNDKILEYALKYIDQKYEECDENKHYEVVKDKL